MTFQSEAQNESLGHTHTHTQVQFKVNHAAVAMTRSRRLKRFELLGLNRTTRSGSAVLRTGSGVMTHVNQQEPNHQQVIKPPVGSLSCTLSHPRKSRKVPLQSIDRTFKFQISNYCNFFLQFQQSDRALDMTWPPPQRFVFFLHCPTCEWTSCVTVTATR